MGGFRPARTVKSPSGDVWELYVTKTAMPAWKPGGYEDSDELALGPGGGGAGLIGLALLLVSFLWSALLLPLARFLILLPFAYVKGKRSHAVRIEALNPFPERELLLWTTTDGQVESVLNEIAAGLAEGRVAQPAGAVYSGARTG